MIMKQDPSKPITPEQMGYIRKLAKSLNSTPSALFAICVRSEESGTPGTWEYRLAKSFKEGRTVTKLSKADGQAFIQYLRKLDKAKRLITIHNLGY